MDIHSDRYQVATLEEREEAIEIIRSAEADIARLTGSPVTLIAYEQKEGHQA
ncbi:hypothetical protein KIH86_17875 [Paenibacillus sp. HN-1]|uniref:hypothetical protein n=1 Tax=Paenibacillus TaxID=44249 RepID=UPI001CAA3096|nr:MULTISPECIES: hypothetical protein [Paenibacillus]MBY9078262.1 hypothetical protein [Paenibacillus sp. CGMCC 1.18879]MBY9086079.1 hypothetical protein [Paenibacillus sinensis]